MKKVLMIVLVALVAFQVAAFAAEISGTVKSVDATAMKLEVSEEGKMESTWVAYTAETKWPEGVTDPATLVDKSVVVTTDDVTKAATSVEEAKAAEAPAAAPAEPMAEAPVAAPAEPMAEKPAEKAAY